MSSIFGLQSSYMLEYSWLFTLSSDQLRVSLVLRGNGLRSHLSWCHLPPGYPHFYYFLIFCHWYCCCGRRLLILVLFFVFFCFVLSQQCTTVYKTWCEWSLSVSQLEGRSYQQRGQQHSEPKYNRRALITLRKGIPRATRSEEHSVCTTGSHRKHTT